MYGIRPMARDCGRVGPRLGHMEEATAPASRWLRPDIDAVLRKFGRIVSAVATKRVPAHLRCTRARAQLRAFDRAKLAIDPLGDRADRALADAKLPREPRRGIGIRREPSKRAWCREIHGSESSDASRVRSRGSTSEAPSEMSFGRVGRAVRRMPRRGHPHRTYISRSRALSSDRLCTPSLR